MQYVFSSMKRTGAWVVVTLLGVTLAGCSATRFLKESREDRAGIRAGLEKFLADYKDGTKEGFQVDIMELNVDRDRAAVQVQIRPKDGSGGTTMVRYAMRRKGSEWAVMRSRHVNGPILHPQIEQGQPTSPAGSAPPPAAAAATPPSKAPASSSSKKP